ncbi:MAG: hypothetical protein VX869_01555 [Chloroflexota bacterium]|uniref:Uncharacterized protein n=1 Tax=marine metagenome TaxID=408172 RepID=A0A381VS04_9ZZZZ|nr:hypothetical protein [Chloroflexota bacterium]
MSQLPPAKDRFKSRLVLNNVAHVQEHLEAMQRDPHGLEYAPWKREVDHIWKRTFEHINGMEEKSQALALESIKDTWVSYITHYGIVDQGST